MLKSIEYQKYISACAELDQVDFLLLSKPQRVAFFLNVYQCMYIHNFLKRVLEDEAKNKKSFIDSVLSKFRNSDKAFYYNIGGTNFTMDEIKHGILRNNMKAP